jgi:hypothetical protein
MSYCAEYCLEMPDDFPVDELTQFMATARRVLLSPVKSPAWQEFAGASNLIGWRFRASSEDWLAYKKSLATFGDSASHNELFQRERALFGMFSAGVSCIESTTYSLAALASHPDVLSLPFGPVEQRACSPRNLADWLAPHAAASQLVGVLTSLVTSREWLQWVALRNRMTHRSNLPRIIVASVGAPPPPTKPLNFAPTSSTPRVEAETSDFDSLHNWLAKVLSDLLRQGRQLADGP